MGSRPEGVKHPKGFYPPRSTVSAQHNGVDVLPSQPMNASRKYKPGNRNREANRGQSNHTTTPIEDQSNSTTSEKDQYAKLLSKHHGFKFKTYVERFAQGLSLQGHERRQSTVPETRSDRLDVPQRRRDQGFIVSDKNGDNVSLPFSIEINHDRNVSQDYDRRYQGMSGNKQRRPDRRSAHNTGRQYGDVENMGESRPPRPRDSQSHPRQQQRRNKDPHRDYNRDGAPSHQGPPWAKKGNGQEQEKKRTKKKNVPKHNEETRRDGVMRSVNAGNMPQQAAHGSHFHADHINNGTGGQWPRKQIFESYMTSEEVIQGLKSGQLIQGPLRINPRKYQEAYIPSPDGTRDIFLDGILARNRALNGDIVVVQVLPREKWKVMRSDNDVEFDTLDPSVSRLSREILQRTANVVYIAEQKHSRAATGFLKFNHNKFTMFCPVDHRVPRINVPLADCPADFISRPSDYSNTLFICRITDWPADSFFPEGHLANALGQAGEIEPETEGILTEYDVDFSEFSQDVQDCLPKNLPWTIPPEEFSKRRDLRNECIFTIDPDTARDLDDALSCKPLPDGNFEVGVHIADVSYFVEEGNALDVMASQRATSVYMVQKVIPMLPRLLCEELCSLNPLTDRLTFSVIWTITPHGKILSESFNRSVIRSCVKLSYDHAQCMIEAPEKLFSPEELPPVASAHTIDEIQQAVLNLHAIARNLRAQRFQEGALRLDRLKLSFTLDEETMMPRSCHVYQYRESNELVEEFMLLANIATANQIYRSFRELALLRCHPPPQAKMVAELQEFCDQMGLDIDFSSAGALHSSLLTIFSDDEYSSARKEVLTNMCSRPMQMAEYFCTGVQQEESRFKHYALNVPFYTHFTSPIRRYADVIVHRLLAASLGCGPPIRLTREQIHKQASHCNDKRAASKRAQDLSTELFFGVLVKECGPLYSEAMVMGVLDQSFDIMVLRYGVQKRIYLSTKSLPGLEMFQHHKVGRKSELTLVWAAEGDQKPSVCQVISLFTVVEVQLVADPATMKCSAVLKRPDESSS